MNPQTPQAAPDDSPPGPARYIAFQGSRRISAGALEQVALDARRALELDAGTPVLVFDERSSQLVELDLRGSVGDVLERLARPAPPAAVAARGPGRPRLGVVAREVTLLPRHWDWLNLQPGGASVALRRLVEEARRANQDKDRVRQAQEVSYRFMSAMAGGLPGFEEATRALFAGDRARFDAQTDAWPADIQAHARQLAAPAFTAGSEAASA
jgi:hypothetical protein